MSWQAGPAEKELGTVEQICIWGAGAMGTLLAASLQLAGCPVDLVDADRSRVAQLSKNGLSVTGTAEFHGPVQIYTPDQVDTTYDLVLLLTKQVHNAVAFPQIEAHIHNNSVICTLQNGVPEPMVADYFGAERTLGCAVTWAATMLPDGNTRSTAKKEKWPSALGQLDGKITRRTEWVASILSLMCPVQISRNLTGIRWSKLLVNSSFSGMSAALGCTFGEILDHPEAFRCAQYIARECIHVARALNIQMGSLGPGEDFDQLMDFTTPGERLATCPIYQRLWGGTRDGVASMLPDLLNQRKTEIEYIDGYLSQKGRECGIPTPYTDSVVSVVTQCECGKLVPAVENLRFFPSES